MNGIGIAIPAERPGRCRLRAAKIARPVVGLRRMVNLHAAWIGFLLGCVAGAIPGTFFHREDWLGGYASWKRRMVRLGHISLFGVGLLNLGFALTVRTLALEDGVAGPSMLLLVGAVTMPLVCYLSAWTSFFRHFFFIPVVSITLAIGLFTWRLFAS